ncbi:MAG TPA: TetR family transcriptional regulator [Gaiellaceae bacterium]|nr:TetR family transcriptional regulator [Gaiellaceae bacterium]
MTRKYELKRRAERQNETRQRIVDAAIQLHRTKGPARTTLSDVARAAGVERHTLYRHFPDERAISLACSGHFFQLHPPPDPAVWRPAVGERERLRAGLGDLYAWYELVEDMFTCVLRDAEVHPLTREVVELRGAEPMSRIRQTLAAGLGRGKRVQAVLDLALDFHAWQRLRRSGLDSAAAADLMAESVVCADHRRQP